MNIDRSTPAKSATSAKSTGSAGISEVGVISIRLAPAGVYIDGALTPCQSERLLDTLRGALDAPASGGPVDRPAERSADLSAARHPVDHSANRSARPARTAKRSAARRRAGSSADRLEVVVDSLATVVVPASCYDNALAGSYLAAANMAVAGERAVWVARGEVVVVTACRDDVAEWLQEQYGERVTFTSPLVEALALPERLALSDHLAPADRRATFAVHLTEANAYMALWDNGLKFAEALPYSSAADIVYYVSRLRAEYGLRREKVYLGGEAAVAGKYRRELARSLPLVKKS